MPKKTKVKQPTKSGRKAKSPKVRKALPSVWKLTKSTAGLLGQHKKLFIGITLVYGLLTLLLVGLVNSADINSLKAQFESSGGLATIGSGLSVFVNLLGSSGNSANDSAGTYQFFLGLIASLAIIWALRQVSAGLSIRVRDAYYRGIYPLVPFVLVLLVVGLQLVPMLIGAGIYNQVMSNGIAVVAFEKLAWAALFGLFSLFSLYLISSSIFALYIVTLPDMTPLKALRTARKLVKGRHWLMARKILFLPLALLVIAALIMLPFIIWLTALVPWLFFALGISSLVVIHSYLYSLYRELINE